MASREIEPAVYILTNFRNGTLYVGHTADLPNRVTQHRNGTGSEFTRRHNLRRLVWYEFHDTLEQAQQAEYLLKRWHRKWKLRLIEEHNPQWRDLYFDLA